MKPTKIFWQTLLLTLLLHAAPLAIHAQQTLIYTDAHDNFRAAQQSFAEKNYSRAQQEFQTFLNLDHYSHTAEMNLMKTEAKFFNALCAKHLDNPDAELLFVNFIDEEIHSTYVPLAYYQLGQYYFEAKNYRDMLAVYEEVDDELLSEVERVRYNFQLGYGYFTTKRFKKARPYFAQSIKSPNPYYNDANYYYGIISFFDKDYDSALNSFQKIERNQRYSRAIPYYITYIYYEKKQYDELLKYGVPKTKKRDIGNVKEINQLVGQTYYGQEKYKEALPYLEYYIDKTPKVRKDDIYQLAFAQYKVGKYKEAIKNFEELSSLKEKLGQNALYHLADCFLKTGQKSKARNAFDLAGKMNYDQVIKEVSFFNYAKLSYELGFQSIAVNSLQQFINLYPTSSRATEAKKMLGEILEITQNYKDALAIIESIPNKTPDLLRTYQRITYLRGVEFYKEGNYDVALVMFDKSLENQLDVETTALCHFWKGDIYYKRKNYDETFINMDAYLGKSQGVYVSDKASPANAHYTIGYSLYQQEEYVDALEYFELTRANLVNNAKESGSMEASVYADATLRAGDAHFIQKNYPEALVRYNQVITNDGDGTDYAYYQKGMLLGLTGEPKKKIDEMFTLTKRFPSSNYNDDALYQIALTQVSLENYPAAIKTHQKLIDEYPESAYVRKSLVNLGLIHFNTGDYKRAMQFYELVLKDYPQSTEAQEALFGIRDVFVEQGDADGYAAFVRKYPGLQFTTTAQDSLTYEIAENAYARGDCDKAIKQFNKYLTAFNSGAFALYAHFYRGQCLYSQKDYSAAGKDYDYVVGKPTNGFTEPALEKAMKIALYINKDYQKAFGYADRLYKMASRKEFKTEALRSLVRTSYELEKVSELNQYAPLLLEHPDATGEDITDTHYYLGVLSYKKGAYNKAMEQLQKTAARTTSAKGARARYYIADIYFKRGNLDKAKDAAFKTINETASHEYWVVKSFILLADVYNAKNDIFQAKATLKSIIDNYAPEDELKKEARDKLKALEDKENLNSRIKTEKDNGLLELDDSN